MHQHGKNTKKPIALGTTHLLASDVLHLLDIWKDPAVTTKTLAAAALELLGKLARYHRGFRRPHYEQHITDQIQMTIPVAIELLANYAVVSEQRTEAEVTEIIGDRGADPLSRRCAEVVQWFLSQSPLEGLTQGPGYPDLMTAIHHHCEVVLSSNNPSTLFELLRDTQALSDLINDRDHDSNHPQETPMAQYRLYAGSMRALVAGTLHRMVCRVPAVENGYAITVPNERQLLQQIRDIIVS